MADSTEPVRDGGLVPDDVIARGDLPPLRYRDLPAPLPLRKMLGPGIILAGLALGSGEFVIWPYIVYQSGFVFFWACMVGITAQYFINMEISRWTLATGESTITGFCRLSKHWGWVLLLMNIVPWIVPAWAKGAAEILSWLLWGAAVDAQEPLTSPYATPLAIASLLGCGAILTAGPVIYETVEKVQIALVSLALVLIVVLAYFLVRPDAVVAQWTSLVTLGGGRIVPTLSGDMTTAMLLGALAFAGAGGTTNLGQSNYIKDKGYAMGKYIGRITSPITGQQEAMSEVGYHFPATPENLARWKKWWRAAGVEHFVSFYATCVVSLVLLTLISYSVFYQADGTLRLGAAEYGQGMQFLWGEAEEVRQRVGAGARVAFMIMGVAILLTTEFGLLDVTSRISTDLVKVNWLRESSTWSESRLYYCFLWGTILVACGILLLGTMGVDVGALRLFKLTAALNGGVMFVYSIPLLYLNTAVLPRPLRMSWPRIAAIVAAILLFGFFAVWVVWDKLWAGWETIAAAGGAEVL